MNNFLIGLKNYWLGVLLMSVSANLLAWTTGADPADDLASIGTIPSCSSEAKVLTSPFAKIGVYKKGTNSCKFYCHRWGLVWGGVWKKDSSQCKLGDASSVNGSGVANDIDGDGAGDWAGVLNTTSIIDNAVNPSISLSTRLPTIKELVRLFDYTNLTTDDPAFPSGDAISGDEKGTLFRAWLQVNNDSATFLTGYLVSSTYRNIANDGGDVGDASPKILGIEIETGKVVAFNQDLTLCEELSTSGGCEVSTDVNVYAFKVSELP